MAHMTTHMPLCHADTAGLCLRLLVSTQPLIILKILQRILAGLYSFLLLVAVLQAVIESLLRHGRVPVRVTGPMGHPTRLPYHYDHLLMFAGGVAVRHSYMC